MEYIEADIIDLPLKTHEDWVYIIVEVKQKKIISVNFTGVHPIAHEEQRTLNTFKEKLKVYAFPLVEMINKELLKKLIANEFDVELKDDYFSEISLDERVWKINVDYSKKIKKKIEQILAGHRS
ncbi:hypothetical protein [Oceanobacillus senegalensis]|uniref:hypothetical protein n=1 Tax=Oceanobacillus senegalensis TaxID=1936063 RepID=UPI000A306D2D|nr:hypothetical protein [Oceanobacillus senegalensis]